VGAAQGASVTSNMSLEQGAPGALGVVDAIRLVADVVTRELQVTYSRF
jgi:hypothetical protein